MSKIPLVTYPEVRHVVDLAHRIAPKVDADIVRLLGPEMRVAFVPASQPIGEKDEKGNPKLAWSLLACIYRDETGAAPIPEGTLGFVAEDLPVALEKMDAMGGFDVEIPREQAEAGGPRSPEEKLAVLQDILNELRDPETCGLGVTRNISQLPVKR